MGPAVRPDHVNHPADDVRGAVCYMELRVRVRAFLRLRARRSSSLATAPDACVCQTQCPRQALGSDRAPAADKLRVGDLCDSRAARSHREEQFRILVTTDGLVPPVHSNLLLRAAHGSMMPIKLGCCNRSLTRSHLMFPLLLVDTFTNSAEVNGVRLTRVQYHLSAYSCAGCGAMSEVDAPVIVPMHYATPEASAVTGYFANMCPFVTFCTST